MVMYLGIRGRSKSAAFQHSLGRQIVTKRMNKESFTLIGTEDSLIVWVFGVTVEGATIMQHAVTKSYWNQIVGKLQNFMAGDYA